MQMRGRKKLLYGSQDAECQSQEESLRSFDSNLYFIHKYREAQRGNMICLRSFSHPGLFLKCILQNGLFSKIKESAISQKQDQLSKVIYLYCIYTYFDQHSLLSHPSTPNHLWVRAIEIYPFCIGYRLGGRVKVSSSSLPVMGL